MPSAVLHALPAAHLKTGRIQFEVSANLETTGRDKWVPYRVNSADLGKKMLAIIEGLEGHPASDQLAASPLIHLPGLNWLCPSRETA